jgi:hypothetical protein
MLYVECHADELLARTLGVPRRKLKHEHGKGNIINRLRNYTAGTGMLDEDPEGSQPAGLRDYHEKDRYGDLVLMEHKNDAGNRLVVICPRLEDWLYQRAAACGVKPGDYGLPHSAEKLKANPRYEQKPGFKDFLMKLKEDDREVQQLGKWIAP